MNTNLFFKKYKFELTLVGIIVGLTLIAYLLGDHFGIFSNREALEQKVAEFGVWGPFIIIFVAFIDVLIAPFPGGIAPAVSGFLYGKFLGTVYVLIGNVVGANVTFWIARRCGVRFFLFFLKKSKIEHFQEMVKTRQKYLWAAYFIPVLPYDILNIAIGLSEIRWKKFLLLNTLGMTVSMSILTFFGSSVLELFF